LNYPDCLNFQVMKMRPMARTARENAHTLAPDRGRRHGPRQEPKLAREERPHITLETLYATLAKPVV
jgi:hypothetical protein